MTTPDTPFLSIVIPVYNGEGSISRCLESIWSQGLENGSYEIICVDDCSSDGTAALLEKLRNEHGGLRVLKNAANLRAGGSRNHGVREARGEYVLFIDADDYFHPGSLKEACALQQKLRLDILVTDFARHTPDAPNDTLVHRFPCSGVMNGRNFLVKNGLPYAPWKYVFRKALMTERHIWFEERVSCEDVDWSHKMAFFAETMQYAPILLTHYILNDASQTSVEYRNKATVFHRLACGNRVYGLLPLCETPEERRCIRNVARATLSNGILFLNALFISPLEKRKMIRKYVPFGQNWGGVVNFAQNHSLLYSCLSTLISPLFRMAVTLKRTISGR